LTRDEEAGSQIKSGTTVGEINRQPALIATPRRGEVASPFRDEDIKRIR